MPLPKSRTKLLNLFKKIKDEKIRFVISDVIGIENEFRSSNRFPIKKIEDTVDNVSTLIEMELEGEK
jgi:hypothetical protein